MGIGGLKANMITADSGLDPSQIVTVDEGRARPNGKVAPLVLQKIQAAEQSRLDDENARMVHEVKYTDEMLACLNSQAKYRLVFAYAGAGKSTMAKGDAIEKNPKRILYVVYNKSAAIEAAAKMPLNVTVRTQDALARNDIWPRLYAGSQKQIGNIYPKEVQRLEGFSTAIEARLILDITTAYFLSDKPKLTQDHLRAAFTMGADKTSDTTDPLEFMPTEQMRGFLQKAMVLINKIVDPKNTDYPVTFQAMMKQYQMSYPIIRGYDELVLDEAQDVNAVFASIVQHNRINNPDMGITVIGDHNQSIYEFRGATNFLNEFKADAEFNLTKSFRFGRGVALYATFLLSHFKGETAPVVGAGKHVLTDWSVDRNKPYAVVARTNGAIFEAVSNAMDEGKSIHMLGGLGKYRFEPIMDAYHLWAGKPSRVTSPELRHFKNWNEFEAYSTESKDPMTEALRRVVKKHGHQTPKLITRIKESNKENREDAHVIFSTAHSAKGDEFEQVVLTDDFPSLLADKDGNAPQTQEINLLYVAFTRAKRALELPPNILQELKELGCSLDAVDALQRNNMSLADIERLPKQLPSVGSKTQLLNPSSTMDPEYATEQKSALPSSVGNPEKVSTQSVAPTESSPEDALAAKEELKKALKASIFFQEM